MSAVPRATRCVMLLSHREDDVTLSRHRALADSLAPGFDVALALTGPPGAATLPDAVERLSPEEIFPPAYGRKSASGRIVPGNTDLALLAFARRRPWYEHVWLVEYDIWFAAGAGVLAQLDAASDAGLIVAQHLRAPGDKPGWPWWPTLRTAPLPAGPNPLRDGARSALLCLARFDAGLIATLDAAYRAGWAGHSEAAVPTIAWRAGFAIETVNAVARRALGAPALDDASFGAMECKATPGALIYHPVKTAEREATLRRVIARRAARDAAGVSDEAAGQPPHGG